MINNEGLKKALKPTGWVRDSVMDAGNYVFTIHQRVASAWTDHASGHDDVQPVFTLGSVTEFLGPGIHYPDCWDTAAYPSVFDALRECSGQFRCTECSGPFRCAECTGCGGLEVDLSGDDERPTRKVGHVMLTPLQDLIQAKIHGIAREFMNKRQQGFFMHEVRAMLNETLTPSVPVVHATFESGGNGITGRASAPVKRVEYHDDGSLEVVIDHWPRRDNQVGEVTDGVMKAAWKAVRKNKGKTDLAVAGYVVNAIWEVFKNGTSEPSDVRICSVCDGGPGNEGPCLCGERKWESTSPHSREKTVQVHIYHQGKIVWVDESIASLVQVLNDAGFTTVASCSGHGHRPGNIALSDGRELIIARDFSEGRMIDKLFPVGINGEVITPYDKLVDHYKGVSYESAAPDYVLKAIEDEPELPNNMPDSAWEAIKNCVKADNRRPVENWIRNMIRETKEGIAERVKQNGATSSAKSPCNIQPLPPGDAIGGDVCLTCGETFVGPPSTQTCPRKAAKPSVDAGLHIGWKGWYTSKEGTVWYGCEVIAFDEGEPVIRTIKGNYHLRPTSEYQFSKEVPKYQKAATGRYN